MLVLIPGSWECSFPGRSEASAARSAAPPGLSRCRTPHGAARQQVTALHHCHRAAAAAEAQPWLVIDRSRAWGKAPEKLKAFGTSGLASASLLPAVTLLLVAPQPRARSDPRACPGSQHCPGRAHWHCCCGGVRGVPTRAVPGAALGDLAGCCSGAAVFPGTETLLKKHPKILLLGAKRALGCP